MACRAVRFFHETMLICKETPAEKGAPLREAERPAPKKSDASKLLFIPIPRDWYPGLFSRRFNSPHIVRSK